MSLDKQRHGGLRKGAGRPKKKASELQYTHSIRATNKDWDFIQSAVRTIKACDTSNGKKPRVFVIDEDEYAKINKILIDDLIENHHIAKWGKPEPPEAESAPPPIQKPAVTLQEPRTASEEEAVSIFLDYFRLNPIEAMSVVQTKLERERHIRRQKELREEQNKILDRLQERMDDAFDDIDSINERVANLLRFPGYK